MKSCPPSSCSVFEAFGKIKKVELAPDNVPGKHRGWGYIEYDNHKSSADAIASMNLFDLGGQFLRVGRVSSYSLPVNHNLHVAHMITNSLVSLVSPFSLLFLSLTSFLLSLKALTPPIPLYPPNAGPVLPGLLNSAALGASSNIAAVAAVASAAALQASSE